MLEDEDHKPWLQVSKQKTKQEGLDDEEHQRLLITEGVHECYNTESAIPHASKSDSQKRVSSWIIPQLVDTFNDTHQG